MPGISSSSEVHLVFVGPYSGDPSSLFGHVFLYIQKSEKPQILSDSFGFSAKVREENFVSYIGKGLTGGFMGSVTSGAYHQFLRRYSSVEDREIYVFKFITNAAQAEYMANELSRMQDFKHPYYFTSYNCTTFIRDYLKRSNLMSKHDSRRFEDYPYLLVRELLQKRIISLIDYTPSKSSSVNSSFSEMGEMEKDEVVALIEEAKSNHPPSRVKISRLSREQKKFFSDLYEYESLKMENSTYAHILSDYLSDNLTSSKDRNLILKKEGKLEQAHKGQRLKFSFSSDNNPILGYRHTYSGQKEGKTFSDNHDSIEFMDFDLIKENNWKFYRTNLLEIYSLKQYSPITPLLSKKIQIFAEKLGKQSIDRKSINGQLGFTKYNDKFKFFTLVGLDLSTWDYKFKASASALGHISFFASDRNQFFAEYSYVRSFDAKVLLPKVELGIVHDLMTDFKLRMMFQETTISRNFRDEATRLEGLYYF